MFCQKCGKEIDNEAIVCPSCGCGTSNYSKPTNEHSKDYLTIMQFDSDATTIRNLGIVAAVLFMGIGLIFSIIIWLKNVKVPYVTTTNPEELAIYENAKRKWKTASTLACLPIWGIVLGMFIGLIASLG